MRHLYALILGTSLCVPSLAAAAAPSREARPVATTTAAAPAAAASPSVASAGVERAARSDRDTARADRARYAAKEAQSGDAKDYRGGDTVVIGASAATAILAVLLILVLI